MIGDRTNLAFGAGIVYRDIEPILEFFLSRLDEIAAAQAHAPPSPA